MFDITEQEQANNAQALYSECYESLASDSKLLIKLIKDGNFESVELLLDKGADVNAREETSNLNHTALQVAIFDGTRKIINLLLDNGADIELANREGDTALLSACRTGHIDVVQLLLERGANPSVINNFSQTAKIIAKEREDYHVMSLINDYLPVEKKTTKIKEKDTQVIKNYRNFASAFELNALTGTAYQKELAEKIRYDFLSNAKITDEMINIVKLSSSAQTAAFWLDTYFTYYDKDFVTKKEAWAKYKAKYGVNVNKLYPADDDTRNANNYVFETIEDIAKRYYAKNPTA